MSDNKNIDNRNVIDHYKYWNTDAIKADLDTKRHNFSVLCSNLYNDFNISTVIRNANAFLAKEVIIYGRKQYDRRGTVGTHHYTQFKHVREIDDLRELLNNANLSVVGVDNLPGAIPIDDFAWNDSKHTIICFGQEQVGLPKEVLDLCENLVYIRQYGSVRSLNVGCASSIAMFDYCKKMVK